VLTSCSPYWAHCDRDYLTQGVFDPPGAVPPMPGLFNSPLTSASPVTFTTTSASAQSTPNLGQAAKTSSSDFHSTTTTAAPNPVYVPPEETPTTSVDPAAPSSQASGFDPASTTTSVQIVAVIGTGTIDAIPDSSGVVLPDGSTATVGSVTTLTDSNNAPVVASVDTSGIYLEGTDSSSIYLPNPTADASSAYLIQPVSIIKTDSSVILLSPHSGSVTIDINGAAPSTAALLTSAINQYSSADASPIATIGNQTISAAPGASTLVVEGQTISVGGSPITLTENNAVASLAPSGLEVQYSDGPVSSFALPTSNPITDPTPIATIGSQIISATPGASTLIIGDQTLSVGGPAATLSENNAVASLAPSGLVVEYPGGGASVFVVPTPSLQISAGGTIETIDGYTVSTLSSGSALVLGSQTLSIGGPIVTVGNDDVMSLGSSGIVLSEPGGEVTTFAIQSSTLAQYTATITSGNSSASAISSGELASIPK
jgi:hypothetical protein